MRRLCLVFIESDVFDRTTIFAKSFEELGFDVEVIRIPFFGIASLTTGRLNKLKKLLKEKSQSRFVIFCPGSAELFLEEADLLFVFSAYRSWHKRDKMRV